MLLLFFVPLSTLIFGGVSNPLLVFGLYILSGLGMAGIGMGIMHDAIHGSFSKNTRLNNIMSNTINLIGSNKHMWRIQHNVLHHSFTNIEDHDDDINAPFFLRFSPHAPKNKLHRYQHWYAWFFYGLCTISWITIKDFINLEKFRKKGLIPERKLYFKYLVEMAAWKLIYIFIVLLVPIYVLPIPAWMVILSFLAMQFVTGLCISLVFQVAHVMPEANYPLPDDDGQLENERMEHQLYTTCNFAQKGRTMFWALGGLTNQIEHHLFPHISHIHYKKLAPIVRQTAQEFNLPYHTNGNFFSAIKSHFRMLKSLGA